MRNELRQHIDSLINNNSIVLFMKGSKDKPQCGFSKQVVDILHQMVGDFITVDVLSDPELREGIKIYSSWPTIPQLYINGEFVGGCDIVLDLFRKNELQKLLNLEKATVKPTINLSPAALDAFKKASLDCQDDEKIRLSINIDFEHNLSFDRKGNDDFCLSFSDLEIIIDPYSAFLAHNLRIDYITQNLDSGFSFDNPNEPPVVNELSVEEFKAWHTQGKDVLLIDVRPKSEREIAHISFARSLSEMTKEEIANLKKNQVIVFHCHHGGRSKRMGETFRKKGFTNLYNLTGGIDAWAKKIDKAMPVY
jgi:monothiol glutaredoxin